MKQGGGGSLDQVVKLLQRGGRVGLLIGAGVSVSAGLPDFRSPGGMYDTLRPELLTATDAQKSSMRADPTNVVSWRIFSQNQFVYHEVRRPFILGIAQGQWKPTLSHFFIRVLQDKNLLEMLFSCNIDGLDHSAGITRIVNVHGSIGRAECEGCGAPFPWAEYTNLVRSNIRDIYGTDPQAPSVSSNIPCRSCGANLVKPATVLYGRALPQSFFEAMNDSGPKLDLLVVAGTSLTVSPSSLVPTMVRGDCLRLLINRDPVGAEMGLLSEARDVFLQGDCDAQFIVLADALGWLPELATYKDAMADASRALLEAALAAKK